MIETLPNDIQEYVFSFFSPKQRMQVAKVNKNLYKSANAEQLWKLDCQKANIPIKEGDNYKALFIRNLLKKKYLFTDSETTYYTVGSVFWKKVLDDPYSHFPKPRKQEVTPEKIAHCFPLKRKINIFQTLEEAKMFVNGIEDYDRHLEKESSYPIFSINLKGDIQSRLIHDSHREKPCDSSFMFYSYSEVDIRDVTNVFPEVWFDKKDIMLDRKISVKENSKGLFLVFEIPKIDAEINSSNCCLI